MNLFPCKSINHGTHAMTMETHQLHIWVFLNIQQSWHHRKKTWIQFQFVFFKDLRKTKCSIYIFHDAETSLYLHHAHSVHNHPLHHRMPPNQFDNTPPAPPPPPLPKRNSILGRHNAPSSDDRPGTRNSGRAKTTIVLIVFVLSEKCKENIRLSIFWFWLFFIEQESDRREGKGRCCWLRDEIECCTSHFRTRMIWRADTWRNGWLGKIYDHPVYATPNHHPP